MRTIKVDDEVFAYLQSKARPFVDEPNDVLRRELLGDGRVTTEVGVTELPARRPGALARIIQAGLMSEGDRLTYTQPRRGQTYHAVITADGWIVVDGLPDEPFNSPSPALKHCVGHEINGWNWLHEPTGRPIWEFRDEVQA